MATCCYDKDAILAYDFEDAAPLSAYFDIIIGSVANTGGVGINGSRGAQSSNFFDEFTHTFDTQTDQCGNGRRTFGLGGQWKVNDETGSFYIMELRVTDGGGQTIYSVYQDLRSLVIYNGTGSDELFRMNNVFTNGVFVKVEVRGSISSFDAATFPEDGWLEVRVNQRVYKNGDDFASIDPTSPPDPCGSGVSGIATLAVPTGWDRVTWSPHGALDCIYVKESASYCDDQILGTPGGSIRCPDPGPGGDPNGPRTVQPGGFPATYVQPTGGGRLPTASDPTNPQTMASIRTPIVTLDLTLPDATIKRYSTSKVPRSGAAPAVAKIAHWGDVIYPMSDRFGSLQPQNWEVGVNDADGTLRAILASGSNRFYKRWEGILYIEDDAARLAGTTRRKMARGRVVSVRVEDIVVILSFADELSRHDSPYSLDRELPHVLCGDVFKEGMSATGLTWIQSPSDEIIKLPTPILLGEYSDERRINENPPVTPIGIAKLYDVGSFNLVDGNLYAGLLVCLYAVKSIAAVFGSNQSSTCPSSVRIDPENFSNGKLLVPGLGNWSSFFSTNYIDITTGGITYRVTMIFGRGVFVDAHRDGKVPMSANVNGVESTGDTSGTMIDDMPYMAEFLLEHPVLRSTKSGNWGTYSAFTDGVSKVRHSSFTSAKAILDARISGGYKGAFGMYERKSAREHLADLFTSSDLRPGLDHHGSVNVSTLNDVATLTSLTKFVDVRHIVDGSFKITSELNAELETRVEWDAGPEEATERTSVVKQTTKSDQAETNWGDAYKAEGQTFRGIYVDAIGKDLAGRRILATQNGITRGEFEIDLTGGDLTQGQLIRLSDFRGIGSTGWTNRILRVTDRIVHPDADRLSFTIRWEDVNDQLVAPSGVTGVTPGSGPTTSAVGFHPVGNAATGIAPGTVGGGWVIGNASDGSAWRVG